ncbi:MAG: Gfo/Idh/MocA family oxidoreductase [Chloroflexi bacterium]|nr:Gfo/Idh/MocA family oxidoreductase [Chloroflexota bacterium]
MHFDKIRTMIVGMGGISRTMLRALENKTWHELVAVVDVNEEALQKAAADYSLPDAALFTDLASACGTSPANVVLINTPSELHYAQTKTALEAGLTPLVAKPLANCFAHARDLANLALEKRIKLCVGQQMRYRRHYLSVAEFLAGGALGAVEQIYFLSAKPRHQARNLKAFLQPVLYEMTCHHLDTLFAILPDLTPESVICDGFLPSWSPYASDCMINGLFRFRGGVHMLYHAGYSTQSSCYELRLEGTKGALRCRGIHMSNDAMDYEFAERGAAFSPIDLDRGRSSSDPWSHFFDLWYDYLNGAEEPPFSANNNLKILSVIDAAIRSLERGAFVEIANSPTLSETPS